MLINNFRWVDRDIGIYKVPQNLLTLSVCGQINRQLRQFWGALFSIMKDFSIKLETPLVFMTPFSRVAPGALVHRMQ